MHSLAVLTACLLTLQSVCSTTSSSSLSEDGNRVVTDAEEKRSWRDIQSGWGKRAWDSMGSGWGKRSWDDMGSGWGKRDWNNLQSGWGKRGWNNLQSGWGKRGWNNLQSGWGKRGWNNLQSGWGKRGWNNLQSGWGKRGWDEIQSGWGKRTWDRFNGGWGKRAPFSDDDVDYYSSTEVGEWAPYTSEHKRTPSKNTRYCREGDRSRECIYRNNPAGSWGKRVAVWGNLKGLWGKRSAGTAVDDSLRDFSGEGDWRDSTQDSRSNN